MKKFVLIISAFIIVAFYTSKPLIDYPVLKYYDTINTTTQVPFTTTEIHNYWNDIGDTVEAIYHYAFYGRNFNWDTLYLYSYPIDSTNMLVNYNATPTTYTYGFNRTISNIPMDLDTLGNSSLLWGSKDSNCRVFKQLVKLISNP